MPTSCSAGSRSRTPPTRAHPHDPAAARWLASGDDDLRAKRVPLHDHFATGAAARGAGRGRSGPSPPCRPARGSGRRDWRRRPAGSCRRPAGASSSRRPRSRACGPRRSGPGGAGSWPGRRPRCPPPRVRPCRPRPRRAGPRRRPGRRRRGIAAIPVSGHRQPTDVRRRAAPRRPRHVVLGPSWRGPLELWRTTSPATRLSCRRLAPGAGGGRVEAASCPGLLDASGELRRGLIARGSAADSSVLANALILERVGCRSELAGLTLRGRAGTGSWPGRRQCTSELDAPRLCPGGWRARLFMLVSVSGWSGPSLAFLRASVSSRSLRASACRPRAA